MAEKINATCAVCGKGYHMCLSCHDKMKAEPWKVYTDTSEHYKVFQVLRGYNIGIYDKDEAKAKLQMIDLSDLNSLRNDIKKTIKTIMKEDKNIAEAVVKTEVEAIIEGKIASMSEVAEDVEDGFASEETKVYGRKKYSK